MASRYLPFYSRPASPPRPIKKPKYFQGDLPGIGLTYQGLRDINEKGLVEVFAKYGITGTEYEPAFRQSRKTSKDTSRKRDQVKQRRWNQQVLEVDEWKIVVENNRWREGHHQEAIPEPGPSCKLTTTVQVLDFVLGQVLETQLEVQPQTEEGQLSELLDWVVEVRPEPLYVPPKTEEEQLSEVLNWVVEFEEQVTGKSPNLLD